MKFGTSGLRGLVTEMTDPVCARYAGAFLRHLAAEGAAPAEVLVGRDLRPSSPRIAAACLAAIRAEGAAAVDCGVVPTPALALEAGRRGAPAVMVTGSHIPFDRNGLKFYRPDGEITKADEAGIDAALATTAGTADAPARSDDTAADAYLSRCVDFFGSGCLAGRRVGLYQHSAAGRDLMAEALARLGAEVVPLGRTDEFVPIDTEAIAPEDAARIRAWVTEHRLDALVCTDGDGDRPLVADETGAVLRGDALGALVAHLLGADAVATPINASTALERSGWFARIRRTRIGSPYVIAAMDALAAEGATLPIGYEANGGFLLGGTATRDGRALSPLTTRDALLPTLENLSFINSYGKDNTKDKNITCANEENKLKTVRPGTHQMALRSFATTRLIAKNCIFRAYGGDTVSPWNTEDGMFYFKDCIMEGGVDLYCPRGWAYAEGCTFICHNKEAAIWHDGSKYESSRSKGTKTAAVTGGEAQPGCCGHLRSGGSIRRV
jgi:phosphomannomutase